MAEATLQGGRSGRYIAPGSPRNCGEGRNGDRQGSTRGGRGGGTHRGEDAAENDRDWRRRDTSKPTVSNGERVRPASAPPASTTSAPVVGTLVDMCSREEVRARARIKDVSRFERSPQDEDASEPSWAVKKYRRPAAGRIEIDVAQLRPPHVLEATLRHLFTNVLPRPHCGFDWSSCDSCPVPTRPQDFLALYHFLNDRVRSVRQDFVVQRVRGRARVVALVQTARFYVSASFRAALVLDLSSDQTLDWSEPLNDQQLASALTEVHVQFESAATGDDTTDRALHEEAVAYDIILHLRDARAVSLLLLTVASPLLDSVALRRVLALFVAFHTGDWCAFSRTFRMLPVLQRCLALRHLPVVWVLTMQCMNKAFGKIDRFALSEVALWTGLPNAADARFLCGAMNIHTEDDQPRAAASTTPHTTAVDSWEDETESGQVPVLERCSGFAKFKINPIRGELDEAAERTLLRTKADEIQSEVARQVTATDLVMGNFSSTA